VSFEDPEWLCEFAEIPALAEGVVSTLDGQDGVTDVDRGTVVRADRL
jgi:hypothetical protein